MRRRALIVLGLLLVGACECDDRGFTELVPLLSPDAARVALPAVYLGASGETTLLFHSSGTASVEIIGVALEDPSAEGFALVDNGVSNVRPGDALEVRVSFTPRAAGPAAVAVVVESDAENAPTRILLEAEGLAPLDCGETTTCQRRTFVPETGSCLIEDLEGPCDDDNACTEDDHCSAGRCVGAGVACPEPFPCTRGVCSQDLGCELILHDELCEDDGNPCTIERCDADRGCVREDAPEGSLCGPAQGCATAQLCFSGACTTVEVPDGTPCVDGEFCTVGDVCNDGVCAGSRVARPPQIAGEVRTFGGRSGLAALLADRRILFLDPHGVDRNGETQTPGYVMTVVQADDDGLSVLAQTDFAGEAPPSLLVEAAPGVVLGLGDAVLRFEIDEAGGVQLAAVGAPLASLPEAKFRAQRLPDGRVAYVGSGNGNRRELVLVDPDALTSSVLAPVHHVASFTPFAGGIVAGTTSALLFVTLDGAVTPLVGATELSGRVLAARDDLLAVVPFNGSSVALYDTSFQVVGHVLSPSPFDVPAALALDGDRLIVSRSRTVAYDAADPSSPVALEDALPWSSRTISFRDGLGLVGLPHRNADGSMLEPYAVAEGTGSGLQYLPHPRLGTLGFTLAQQDSLLTFSRTSVHRVDVSALAAPLVEAGGILPPSHDSLALFFSGSDGALLDDDISSARASFLEVDLPSHPRLLRSLALSFEPARARDIAASRRLMAIASQPYAVPPAGGAVRLDVFDLDALPAETEMSWAPTSATALPLTADYRQVRVAMDDEGQLAVLAVPEDGSASLELALVDASVPAALAPVAHGALMGTADASPASFAWSSGTFLAIQDRTVVLTLPAVHRVLVLQALPDGSLVETMRFESPETDLLAFDGRTLLLGGVDGAPHVAFWDVAGTEPVDLGTVALPDVVHDADAASYGLALTGETSVVTLDPPCPPLP